MFRCLIWLVLALLPLRGAECPALQEIRSYIHEGWKTLTRSNASAIESAQDSKVRQSGQVAIWVASDEDAAKIEQAMKASLPPAEAQRLSIRKLTGQPDSTQQSGLLYLPKPYVVPGGRFNEMYGWDSYFILEGLIRDGQTDLAKSMTDNFLYEVQHYGKVLNANRTYYLTRSQPPFLSRMVLDVYREKDDTAWLKRSLPALESYYDYWMREPHFTPETGLSRYYGGSDQPAPEVVFGERDDSGKNHYDRVIEYYKSHDIKEYDAAQFYDPKNGRLTPLFFEGDRAMRESGFDPSARFGPFSVAIVNYNPVDLNSLLYRTEMDMAAIFTLLDEPRQAEIWTTRAEKRSDTIRRLMWDEKAGLFFDYDFVNKRRSGYPFLTTFYPLWAGFATPEQAARVAANLPLFEKEGGLQTSTNASGNQWDAPFGWAPLEIIAIQGLRRYGFRDAAERLSVKFLAMILADFAQHRTIKEKYDVVRGKSDLGAGIKFGYTSNEIGFGWTNAAFLLLYDELSPAGKQMLEQRCPVQ
ncbi:MAG: Alpha,alpha-trehalase [Bryobacterales bacterium]|nr:Alpha,alpha-trehalase [Bryobacterales bacterium]